MNYDKIDKFFIIFFVSICLSIIILWGCFYFSSVIDKKKYNKLINNYCYTIDTNNYKVCLFNTIKNSNCLNFIDYCSNPNNEKYSCCEMVEYYKLYSLNYAIPLIFLLLFFIFIILMIFYFIKNPKDTSNYYSKNIVEYKTNYKTINKTIHPSIMRTIFDKINSS